MSFAAYPASALPEEVLRRFDLVSFDPARGGPIRPRAVRPARTGGPAQHGAGSPRPTAGPILVVGTRHDPAAPYTWAQRMQVVLGNATLLTWDSDGHTAYPMNDCINHAVDQYLIAGTVPDPGRTCPPTEAAGTPTSTSAAPFQGRTSGFQRVFRVPKDDRAVPACRSLGDRGIRRSGRWTAPWCTVPVQCSLRGPDSHICDVDMRGR